MVYLSTMVLAFLQFSTHQESFSLDCTTSEIDFETSCKIIPGFFGQLFHFLAFILVITAVLLVLIDKVKKHSFSIVSFITWIIITSTLFGILIAYFHNPVQFFDSFSGISNALVIIWLLMIEPVLFFKSLIIILEIVSEDYEFKGFGKKTQRFLIVDFLILFVIVIFIFWLLMTFKNTSDYTLLPGIEVNYDNTGLLLGGAIVLVFSCFFSILYFFVKERKKGSSEKIEYQKSIIPWVTFYAIIFFIIRGIPGGFIWDDTLRSITNFIDIMLLIIILLIGINGVINLPDSTTPSDKIRFSRPFTWMSGVPKYSKILFLFFLGAEIFYSHLENEAISVLTGFPNSLADLKAAALTTFVIIGFISVFLNFKPKKMPEGHIGPVRFLNSILISILYFFVKERKKGSSEKIEYQKSIIPWVTFYAIIFFIIRGIPGGFIWDDTLRSITNFIDIMLLIIILLIGINGVINLPDSTTPSDKIRFSRPFTWMSGVPKYSKILFLFFLGAEIFYSHLENEAISVLTGFPNSLADLKAAALTTFVIIGFISVFLNFKPKKMPEGHIGPVRFLNSILISILYFFVKERK
ncbi:MAG: hypothetical protein HeimC3_28860, partial [Candidatus Heimdallarchaeota archaeon LC_3]